MDLLTKIDEIDYFSSIDRHFARFMTALSTQADPVIGLSAALVSRNNREGDVCIDLSSFAGLTIGLETDALQTLTCPELSNWREHLRKSDLVGGPGEYYPLIRDDADRLYLYRYWEYEKKLIDLIHARNRSDVGGIEPEKLKRHLDIFFPEAENAEIDWQKLAAAVVLLKRFCVISGGPGTGKTYAIARILATLIEQHGTEGLRIYLAAPTGKAAARLAESIGKAKRTLACDARTLEAIPDVSSTIHRMLRPVKDSPYFTYNGKNPLPADVVVVDEASMVDLPLMSKLIQALPEKARLILIGDRHQLASVQAGSVLGDICGDKIDNGFSRTFARTLANSVNCNPEQLTGPRKEKSDIQDSMVYFTRSYRFEKESGIDILSRAVNAGAVDDALNILRQDCYPELSWFPLYSRVDHQKLLSKRIHEHYGRLCHEKDPQEALDKLNRFRILCAVNHGGMGVDNLNARATAGLAGKENIRPPGGFKSEWYHGRPVLITANDYNLGLFIGDVGIAMFFETANEKTCHVYFQSGHAGTLQRFTPSRLPRHQDVYAMTIHKSQGSEFDEVLLVLPEKDNPVLTRELLYTGITRARRKLSILASESVIRSAVSKQIERTSGLRDALWG
ncbi:MAG: exodeoxyribonuclease V subunit alpha [Desulfobacterales bacterium]|nr:exodeoxyribonuclease V subunit alpha [Desulfobacterales bacterium]MDX2512445.1 exodeoxyribonuclease V subunit alpha [Desulfobacterales bacterium]